MTNQMSFCKVENALKGEGIWEVCNASGDGPCGRSGHTMTPLSNHSFAIFGGVDSKDEFLSDIFIYDARDHSWATIKEFTGDIPPPMSAHATICHRQTTSSGMLVSNRLLVYGGSCMVEDDSVTAEVRATKKRANSMCTSLFTAPDFHIFSLQLFKQL